MISEFEVFWKSWCRERTRELIRNYTDWYRECERVGKWPGIDFWQRVGGTWFVGEGKKEDWPTPRQYALRMISHEMGQAQTPIELAVGRVIDNMNQMGRSQVVVGDRYIVDFQTCSGVVVECDGREFHKERDTIRDQFLVEQGCRVLHIPGESCFDEDYCYQVIRDFIDDEQRLVKYA